MYTNHLKKTKKGGAGGAIMIRILVITLLVIMPLIPTQTVLAQCEIPPCPTETPVPPPVATKTPMYGPTIENPFDATPTPVNLGDCPKTVRDPNRPISMDWLNKCSQCKTDNSSGIPTFALLPTFDLSGGGGTVYPTAQPAGTPTVLPPLLGGYQTVFLENDIVPYGITTSRAVANSWVKFRTTQGHHPQTFNGRIDFKIDLFNVNGMYGAYLGFYVDMGSYINHLGVRFKVINTNMPNLPVGEIYINPSQGFPSFEVIPHSQLYENKHDLAYFIEYEVETFGDNVAQEGQEQIRMKLETSGTNSSSTGSVSVIWRSGNYPVTNLGTCSTYGYSDNLPGGLGAGDPLFNLPDLHIWQGQCIDFIPPFAWARDSSGSFLFNIDLSFPGVGICPVWVDIEPLEIAEIPIPFEILILPAVMFVFSLIYKL